MIRYDSDYNQKISRVVSNFNRKVRRLEKEEHRLLPSPVKVSDINKLYFSRRELNKYLNDLKKFSKPGAEDIVRINGKEYTKYQIDLFKTNLRREREQLRRQIPKMEGIQHKYPVQHDINLQNLKNRQEKLTSSWQKLIDKEFTNVIERQQRNLETYDNYFQVLFQDAYQIGFPEEKIEHIKNKLLELSPSQFMLALRDSKEIQFIFNFYHSMTRQAGVRSITDYTALNALYNRIDQIVENYK